MAGEISYVKHSDRQEERVRQLEKALQDCKDEMRVIRLRIASLENQNERQPLSAPTAGETVKPPRKKAVKPAV